MSHVEGTDVQIAHHRMGDDIVLRVVKRSHEALRVHVVDGAKELSDVQLKASERVNSDFVVPIAKFAGSRRSGANTMHCSFCGKSQHEVRKMVAGQSVFICDECAELVAEIVGSAK